jgi:hypothetical protein
MLVYPRGGWGNNHVKLGAYLLLCQMSPKQVWSQWLAACEPSCFLSVMWHGEAFHGLGLEGVEVLILLVLYFHQVWLQHLSKIFDLWSSCCLLLCPSCHLGSPICVF